MDPTNQMSADMMFDNNRRHSEGVNASDEPFLFYKTPDAFMLVYKASMSHSDVINQLTIDDIHSWIQQKEVKRQDWCLIILFEIASFEAYDPKMIDKRFNKIKHTIFKGDSQ